MRIQVLRAAGEPRPWTLDPTLAANRFCCVRRDDDRTSVEARGVIMALPEADRLGAVLGFRLYNRVSTLVALRDAGWDASVMLTLSPALNTLAYKISVQGGLFNLVTISRMVSRAFREAPRLTLRRQAEHMCPAIRGATGAGAFLAYQTAQDIRWIAGPYDDEDEWCVLGLGACRGLARLLGQYHPMDWRAKEKVREEDIYKRELGFSPREDMVLDPKAQAILKSILPEFKSTIPGATMHDLEHNLCEWDKWERITSGEGRGRKWKPLHEQ